MFSRDGVLVGISGVLVMCLSVGVVCVALFVERS